MGIADLTGRLLTEHHESIDASADAPSIAQRIVALFDWMIAKHARDLPI